MESGVTKGYHLKDKDCLNCAFGTVVINCELVYNHVRPLINIDIETSSNLYSTCDWLKTAHIQI